MAPFRITVTALTLVVAIPLAQSANEPPKREVITGRPTAEAKLSITAGGVDDVFLRRSKCCEPLPGEEVIGYVTRGKGMAIQRRC